VASHDLQEPLRMITSFVQLLAQQYKGKLDGEADEFMHYITEGADRMKQLISDLLAYSRVSVQPTECALTNCDGVLKDTLMDLSVAVQEKGAVITSDPLPTVLADRSQMLQPLQNLLSNALKFCGPQRPQIHISARRTSDEWLFSVRDNGIGIGPEHYERVFAIFQRLHDRTKYPGTGIGLAICKKIVEGYGGRIWVESEPGSGSTFYFTLRAAEEEPRPMVLSNDAAAREEMASNKKKA
jgi:light-regulated signal transduction histidine kinase (bacteriophytochrome)